MGRWEQGTGLAFSLSACSRWTSGIRVRDIIKIAGAISLTLSTVISNAPASGSVLRGLRPQSNNLSRGVYWEKTIALGSSLN